MCHLGCRGWVGLPQGLSLRPGSPWRDSSFGEARCPWCLRNPAGPVGKAQGQEAGNQEGEWEACRGQVGVAQRPHARGGAHAAHLRGALSEPVSAENTGVEALSPWWVVLGLAGAGANVGESRFLFILFVIWWGRQVHSPAWEHLMSCGWSPACPPFLGHQVDWTDRPGSYFSPLRRRGQVEALSREA